MSSLTKTLTLQEIKCFLIDYEHKVQNQIIDHVNTIEDLNAQRGKIRAIQTVFQLITKDEKLAEWRDSKKIG